MRNQPKSATSRRAVFSASSAGAFKASERGFTLAELMVTLAILIILASMAIPNFNGFIASNRVSSTTNELLASIADAKSQAIRTGKRITICPSSNGTSCSTGSITWNAGWITFIDGSRSSSLVPVVDSGETVTAVAQAVPDGIEVRTSATYISYSPEGRSKDMNAGFLAVTMRVCSTSVSLSSATRARDIKINNIGRAYVEKASGIDSSCPSP